MSIGWYRQQVLTRGSTRRYQSERNLSSCKSTAHPLPSSLPFPPARTHARTLALHIVCRPAVRWGLDSLIRPQVRKLAKVEGVVVVAHARAWVGSGLFLGCAGALVVSWSQLCEGGRGGGGCDGTGWGARQRGGPWPSSGRRSHGRVLPSDSVWEECRGGSWPGDAGCMGVQKGEEG